MPSSSPEPEEAPERWRRLMAELPKQLQHPSRSSAPNEPVLLYEGPFRLRREAETVEGEGTLEYRWLPGPHVYVQGRMTASDAPNLKPADWTLECPTLSLDARCLINSVSLGIGSGKHDVEGRLQGGPWVGRSEPMDELVFLLPNFASYNGSAVHSSDGGMTRGRLTMETGGWLVDVDLHSDFNDMKRELRASGGYGVGHLGRIRRADGGTFSREKAENLLGLLHFLFSFARGFRCGPVLPVARRDGEKVSEKWTRANVSPWTGLRFWLPTVELEQLGDFFEGFLDRWNDPGWHRPLRSAIHWYCAANENEGALEGSLVLAQTALELLTWAYSELERGLSEDQLEALEREVTHESFQRLLGELDIPTNIPAMPPDLRKLAAWLRDEWDAPVGSGPELITRVRNWVVHPDGRSRRQLREVPPLTRRWVRELALWYIELILFRLLSYNGHYMNRLGQPEVRMGSDELVPWSKE